MKKSFRINPKAQIMYIPDDLVKDGWSEDLDGYVDAFTLTLAKPGASLAQIRESLKLILRDIEMRLSHEQTLSKVSPS